MRVVLAVIKDFQQRATARSEFGLSAQAQECANEIRAMEERRALCVLRMRQQTEREGLAQQQGAEASAFNYAWKLRMENFSRLTSRAVQDMRARHENAVEEVRAPRLLHPWSARAGIEPTRPS